MESNYEHHPRFRGVHEFPLHVKFTCGANGFSVSYAVFPCHTASSITKYLTNRTNWKKTHTHKYNMFIIK
jgi:hypothetical protein